LCIAGLKTQRRKNPSTWSCEKQVKPCGNTQNVRRWVPYPKNGQDIASPSSGKWVWQRTKRCHTLNDAFPADERENCSHRRVTIEKLTHAIKAMTVGCGGPRSTMDIVLNGRQI